MKKYFLAAIISLIYIPAVTIVAELVPPLKDFLKNTFWHHWLGKGVILLALFPLLSLAFSKTKDGSAEHEEKYLTALLGLSVLSALSIFFFFTYEYLKHA